MNQTENPTPSNENPSSQAWEEFRKSMLQEENCFDMARKGDVLGLEERISRFRNLEQRNEKGHTLLMLSAYNGQEEAVRLLLGSGADPNSVDDSGNSILMGVAFKGHAKIAELLLASGADPNYRNSKGQTALQFSEMFGRAELCRLLSAASGIPKSGRSSFFKSWFHFITQSIFQGGRG